MQRTEQLTPVARAGAGASFAGLSCVDPESESAGQPRRSFTQRLATQAQRLLGWALAGHALHQDDWYNGGAHGGSAIKAVRSRISELEQDGYGFHHTTRPDRSMEYRLAHEPERAASPQRRDEAHATEPERLFEPPPAPPLNAALRDWEAATA